MEIRKAREDDLPQIDKFLREQVNLCAGWTKEGMISWLRWFNEAVLVGGVFDGKTPIAICIGRPTDDPYKCSVDPYYLRREGNTMWVDFFGGKLKQHAEDCTKLAFEYWGWTWGDETKYIAFNRMTKGRKEVKIYKVGDVCRLYSI